MLMPLRCLELGGCEQLVNGFCRCDARLALSRVFPFLIPDAGGIQAVAAGVERSDTPGQHVRNHVAARTGCQPSMSTFLSLRCEVSGLASAAIPSGIVPGYGGWNPGVSPADAGSTPGCRSWGWLRHLVLCYSISIELIALFITLLPCLLFCISLCVIDLRPSVLWRRSLTVEMLGVHSQMLSEWFQ